MRLFQCAPVNSPVLSGPTLTGTIVIGGALVEGAVVLTKATSSGAVVTIAPTTHLQIVSPPASLLGVPMTLAFPPSPPDGLRIEIASTALINPLTIGVPTGTTVGNAPTSLGAGCRIEYVFSASSSTWFRIR